MARVSEVESLSATVAAGDVCGDVCRVKERPAVADQEAAAVLTLFLFYR